MTRPARYPQCGIAQTIRRYAPPVCRSAKEAQGDAVDIETVAKQLLVALRGRRSQVQWSRRLGYKSNVAYAWESGRRWPTGAETLRAASRSGVDVGEALVRFLGQRPPWLGAQPTSRETVARLLDDLRGDAPIAQVARRAGVSRYSVTRWLAGQTEPRLPDFLRLIEGASLRLVDFVACLVDPEQLPELALTWRRLQARRQGAAQLPWTQAILRALELGPYRELPAHEPGFVARQLGVPLDIEEQGLRFLAETEQVSFTGTHYVPAASTVDTRLAPEVGRELKVHWTEVAADRLRQGAPGQFSYNVFCVSHADFERIRELHLAYYRALRAIVGESQPADVVAVVNLQLFPLGGESVGPK
jgi:transcriptional regulator with XRE-family HTH domain